MKQTPAMITGNQELRLYRRLDLLKGLIWSGQLPFKDFMDGTKELAEKHAPGSTRRDDPQETNYRLSQARQKWFKEFYAQFGFEDVRISQPDASNAEFERRRRRPIPEALFFRANTDQVSDANFRGRIDWPRLDTPRERQARGQFVSDVTSTGYWFWAPVSPECPNKHTPFHSIKKAIISLSEYAIVVVAHEKEKGVRIDKVGSATWLRDGTPSHGTGLALSARGDGDIHLTEMVPSIVVGARTVDMCGTLPPDDMLQ